MARVTWSKELVGAARKILRHHHTLDEAWPDLEKGLGFRVTRNQLDTAFRRLNFPTPASNLKPPEPSPKDELVRLVERKQAAASRRKSGITELLIEKVEAALSGIKPDTIQVTREPEPKGVSGPDEVIWAELSDLQLGTKVEFEKMGGLNAHDWTVWLGKLARWEQGTISTIRERRKARPIKGVVIAALGDIVEGHEIFKGQAYELELDVFQQTIYGARDLAQSLTRICATFPDLAFTIYGVGGNHGRVGHKGEAPYRANFDLVLYHLLQLRLEANGLKNVTCHFPEAWFQVVQTWGWTHLLVHGDDIKGWLGLPAYGIQRAVAKYGQMLQRPINYLHIGHHHAETALSSGLGDALVNGNWIGANSFSKQIVEANTPVQMIHGFSEANGLEWSRKVYLRERVDMKPRVKVYRHG